MIDWYYFLFILLSLVKNFLDKYSCDFWSIFRFLNYKFSEEGYKSCSVEFARLIYLVRDISGKDIIGLV